MQYQIIISLLTRETTNFSFKVFQCNIENGFPCVCVWICHPNQCLISQQLVKEHFGGNLENPIFETDRISIWVNICAWQTYHLALRNCNIATATIAIFYQPLGSVFQSFRLSSHAYKFGISENWTIIVGASVYVFVCAVKCVKSMNSGNLRTVSWLKNQTDFDLLTQRPGGFICPHPHKTVTQHKIYYYRNIGMIRIFG